MSLKKIAPPSSLLFASGLFFLCLIVGAAYTSDAYSLSQLFDGIFVFAQGTDEGMSDLMSTSLDAMQAILQIVYIIMWPLMYIAGLAMDNSLVYGEFINLDGVLWTMRGVSKNLANFALGGFVLYEVIKYAFMGQDSNINNVYSVLKGAIIAGVGIQFSWFLLAAVIDISTILIVSLGGLPLTLMDSFGFGDQPILGVQGYLNLSDTNNGSNNKSDALVYYTWGKYKFPSCRVVEGYVVGGSFNNIVNEQLNLTQNGQQKKYCAFGTKFMVNITDIKKDGDTVAESLKQVLKYNKIKKLQADGSTLSAADTDFLASMAAEHPAADISGPALDHHITNIAGIVDGNADRSTDLEGNPDIKSITDAGVSVDWKTEFAANPQIRGAGTYLSDLTQDGQGFVGPLTTLYVSLLEFSNLHSTSAGAGEASTGMSYFFEFMMKSLVGLMLIVPLIILAVVLIIRVAVLWMVIAFSPILALMRGFGKDSWLSNVNAKISASNIIGLIFAPVLPVFILSLSIVFLQSLTSRFYDPANTGSWEALGLTMTHNAEAQETCATIRGAMTFCYESSSDDTGNSMYANLFAWLLVNMFAIGLVWTLVKVSFQGNSITQGIVNNITKTAGSIAGSIPIIPLPGAGGSGFVGANAFSSITGFGNEGGGSAITRALENKYRKDTQDQITQFELNQSGKDKTPVDEHKEAESKFFETRGANFSADTKTANEYVKEVLKQDASTSDGRQTLLTRSDLPALDARAEDLLQIGFRRDIEDTVKKAQNPKATESDMDLAIAYLNGNVGTKYQTTTGAITLTAKDYSVTDSSGQAKTITIKKDTNGKFEKVVKDNTNTNTNNSTTPTNTPQNTNGTQNTTR